SSGHRTVSEANARSVHEIGHSSTLLVSHYNDRNARTDFTRRSDGQEHTPKHTDSTQEANYSNGAARSDGAASAGEKSTPGIATTFYEHLWAKSNRQSTSTDAAVCGRKTCHKHRTDTVDYDGCNDDDNNNNRVAWSRTAHLMENGAGSPTFEPSSPQRPSETPSHRSTRVWRRPSVVENATENQHSIPRRPTVVDNVDRNSRSESR
ncbi:unnamed protein product, partial [Sphacelaria rigidula]